MPDYPTLLQLGLSAWLLGVIVERVFLLLSAAPLSQDGARFVQRALERADADQLLGFADGASATQIGRILRVAFGPAATDGDVAPGASRFDVREEALAELGFELSAEVTARLRSLRVGATIASTLGLLIGIVRIRGGFAEAPGLLALEAGLSERIALSSALFSMAIGVGTSAVCFYALAILRDAARALITQRTRLENLVLAMLRAAPT